MQESAENAEEQSLSAIVTMVIKDHWPPTGIPGICGGDKPLRQAKHKEKAGTKKQALKTTKRTGRRY